MFSAEQRRCCLLANDPDHSLKHNLAHALFSAEHPPRATRVRRGQTGSSAGEQGPLP